jgi:hypothetical protein
VQGVLAVLRPRAGGGGNQNERRGERNTQRAASAGTGVKAARIHASIVDARHPPAAPA